MPDSFTAECLLYPPAHFGDRAYRGIRATQAFSVLKLTDKQRFPERNKRLPGANLLSSLLIKITQHFCFPATWVYASVSADKKTPPRLQAQTSLGMLFRKNALLVLLLIGLRDRARGAFRSRPTPDLLRRTSGAVPP